MKKRLLIIIISVLVAAAALVVVIYRDAIFSKSNPQSEVSASDEASDAMTDEEDPAFCEPSETMKDESLDKALGERETAQYSENILEMPLSKDGIPPIENPIYTSIEEADLLFEDYDRMFVYEADEGVYVYPQRIMVWHEIVNETIDGQLVSVTYCPLTASVIAYTGEDGAHADNTYGTSGDLLNSNLVMYDRNTDSRIPQILGIGVTGELNGFELSTMPIYWAQWSDVVNTYDEAFVLSMETGHIRDYNRDPYGTYLPFDKWSYYQIGEPRFPLMSDNDGTFADVKVVVGVKSESGEIALDPELVEKEGVVHFIVVEQKAIAVFDNELKTVRVFSANNNGAEMTLTIVDGKLTDSDGMTWSERGVGENGESLEPLTHFDVFWFAWHAYYPDTQVVA